MEKFIAKFAEQFDETLMSEFSSDTIFRDLDEWDSMVALSLIGMIDEEYDITITGEDIKNAKTIRDLQTIVESK